MGEFEDILTGLVTIKRKTNVLLDAVEPSATLTPNRQPSKQCRLNINITGALVNNGIVAVAGNTTETFMFTENTSKIGSKNFSAVNSVVVSGITYGTIQVNSIDHTGAPVLQEKMLYDGVNARVEAQSGQVRMNPQGRQILGEYIGLIGGTYVDVLENDFVYITSGCQGLTLGQITFVDLIRDFNAGIHHIELGIKRI